MKTSKLFIAAISAIVLFASCTKENNGAIEKAGSVSITLSAGMTDASDTKANLGDKTGTSYPMCWEAEGETVAAVITDAEGTKTTVVSEKEYTVSQDSKTADFKFIIAEDVAMSAKSVMFVSPASCVVDGAISYDALADQTPSAAGKADPEACIISSGEIMLDAGITLETLKDVSFTSAVAFANMTIKDADLSGAATQVAFTANGEKSIAGISSTITVDLSKLGISAGENFNVIFAVSAGNEAVLGEGFSVTVSDNNGSSVNKEVKAGTLVFNAGKVSEFSVKMSDAAMETYSLDVSTVDFEGSYVVNVVCGEKAVAQICKEYVRTPDGSCDMSKTVIYPLSDGKLDVTKGIDFETGGSVSWVSGTSKDEVTFTAGVGSVSKLYFCNGEIALGTTSTDVKDASTSYEKFTDGSGNTYPVVKIGKVIWMAQNLYTKKFTNGTSIKSRTYWTKTDGAYRYWNDKSANSKDILYDGFTASEYALGSVAPEGWQVSSYNNWKRLSSYLSTLKGKKLLSEDAGGNNITGLSIDGSGYYDGTKESFEDLFDEIYYWTPDLKNIATETHYAVMFTKYDNTFSYSKEIAPENGLGAYLRCTKEL